MKIQICVIALMAAMSACVSSGGAVTDASPDFAGATEGQVSIGGIEPSRVLGAVNTQTLLASSATSNGDEGSSSTAPAGSETLSGIAVQGASPGDVLFAIDTSQLVGDSPAQAAATAMAASTGRPAEVQAVIDSGKRYTTQDLALAQLEAMRAD